LLRGDDPPEPPYWAHLWSGARVLASAIPPRAGRVLELGCGLGLPALVAARRGARVLATDRETAPLAFVRASARANSVRTLQPAVMDYRHPVVAGCIDLVLLAEVLYDRTAFGSLVRSLDVVLAPGGEAWIADGRRIDTTEFYGQLDAAGFRWTAADLVVVEEGGPVRIRLARVRRRGR